MYITRFASMAWCCSRSRFLASSLAALSRETPSTAVAHWRVYCHRKRGGGLDQARHVVLSGFTAKAMVLLSIGNEPVLQKSPGVTKQKSADQKNPSQRHNKAILCNIKQAAKRQVPGWDPEHECTDWSTKKQRKPHQQWRVLFKILRRTLAALHHPSPRLQAPPQQKTKEKKNAPNFASSRHHLG